MRALLPPDQSLFQFLKAALHVHQRFVSGSLSRAESPIYVIGNPSADIDSIVSALVYSYFANNRVPRDQPRPHVPVINLAKVPAGSELRRLRPEFAKALLLSTRPNTGRDHAGEASELEESSLLQEHFLTVADFAAHLGMDQQLQAESVLVDWNALPIRSSDRQLGKGSLDGLSAVEFTVVGCIDHHADENFLPSIAPTQPHIVEPAGSCASLVIGVLEKMGLWLRVDTKQDGDAKDTDPTSEEQVAKLAMAPVLIDTANLTAKDKVTKSDTFASDFLLSKIIAHSLAHESWNPDAFYADINETKQNSLDLLTVDEILGRDYKEWAEKPSRQTDLSSPLHIGICSMVRSIPWIVRKAGSPESFLESLKTFATRRKLDIVVVMTAFSSSAKDGQFCRELLVCALESKHAVDAVDAFISNAGPQLGLEEWSSLDGAEHANEIKNIFQNSQGSPSWTRIWVQSNVSKSRKQVAPLIRGAVASL